jgi:hypothetical protein
MTPPDKDSAEPLPIWFFVGLILTVYGLLVLGTGIVGGPGNTVLAGTRPALWWGAVMTVAGGVFIGIGWRSHRSS